MYQSIICFSTRGVIAEMRASAITLGDARSKPALLPAWRAAAKPNPACAAIEMYCCRVAGWDLRHCRRCRCRWNRAGRSHRGGVDSAVDGRRPDRGALRGGIPELALSSREEKLRDGVDNVSRQWPRR